MGFNIKNEQAEKLLRQLVKHTGESMTDAVIISLEERLKKIKQKRNFEKVYKKTMEIAEHCSKLPDFDTRTPEEIIGYNEFGHFD